MERKEPTLDEVIRARDECARIIALCGEQFLPIFERLEEEIKILEKKDNLLKRALAISRKTGTQTGTQIGTQLKVSFLKAS